MGILDKVAEQKRKTEEKLARGSGGGSSAAFWRPKDGENKIRVMPSWDNEKFADQFWREVAQHWNVSGDQKGPVLCPKMTPGLGGDCPICEFVEELRADKTSVEAQALAKNIRAKVAFLINVVDLKDAVYTAQDTAAWTQARPDRECPFEVGDPKIQVYACPTSIFDQILGFITNSKQDITDLSTGRNLTIKKIPNKDRLKTRYEVYPDFEKSESEVDADTVLPALDQVGFSMEYDKLVELLDSGVGGAFIKLPSAATQAAPKKQLKAAKKTAEEELTEKLQAAFNNDK